MQESPPYSIGQIARFRYPKSNNLNNLRPIYADRSVLITSVRDVARSGLHPVSLMKRPMKARGRWLITGLCLDTHQERSFYVESMLEHKRDTWLTFGLFDPAEPNIEVVRYGIFAPTVTDRRFMASVVGKFNDYLESDFENEFSVAVFPVDNSANIHRLIQEAQAV
jgi:hypothetical protein